jgi:hypothetical protein
MITISITALIKVALPRLPMQPTTYHILFYHKYIFLSFHFKKLTKIKEYCYNIKKFTK